MTPTYTNAFKSRMVERLTGPNARSASELSAEVGVSQTSLSSWLRQAGTIRAKVTVTKEPRVAKTDTAEGRLAAVLQASQLSEEELGAWLRTHGLHGAQLDEWRAAMLAGLAGRGASGVGTGGHARRVKELERELRRKDRALAEAAALLMLQKKLRSVLGDEDDGTSEPTEL
jgi:transposase-like protein